MFTPSGAVTEHKRLAFTPLFSSTGKLTRLPRSSAQKIALVQEAEMVGAPGIMAGKVGISLNGSRGDGILARPLAPGEDRHPTELDKDLRGTTHQRS
jgi:hypothetical protein